MKDLLSYLVKEITGTDDFEILVDEDDSKVVLTVKLSTDKVGFIIGKEGKTIKSVQEILRVKGKLEKKSVFVDISTKE